jgi:hypothetical protein
VRFDLVNRLEVRIDLARSFEALLADMTSQIFVGRVRLQMVVEFRQERELLIADLAYVLLGPPGALPGLLTLHSA